MRYEMKRHGLLSSAAVSSLLVLLLAFGSNGAEAEPATSLKGFLQLAESAPGSVIGKRIDFDGYVHSIESERTPDGRQVVLVRLGHAKRNGAVLSSDTARFTCMTSPANVEGVTIGAQVRVKGEVVIADWEPSRKSGKTSRFLDVYGICS